MTQDIFNDTHKIIDLVIDPDSLPVTSADMQHERRVAIFDLLEDNKFRLVNGPNGPYAVSLSLEEGSRLVLHVRGLDDEVDGAIDDAGDDVPRKPDNSDAHKHDTSDEITMRYHVSLMPFRRIIKDYFLICENYHNAIRTATSAQIEAIDMGRRGLHNEGSELFDESLGEGIKMDFRTSRRFFTLLCSLHRRP